MPISVEPRLESLDRGRRPGRHALLGRVDRGERDVVVQERQDSSVGRDDGGHRAGGQVLHEPPARGDQAQGIVQGREDAADAGGGELAHAVADHRGRLDPPARPEAGERVLERDDRRLADGRLQQPRVRSRRVVRARPNIRSRRSRPTIGSRSRRTRRSPRRTTGSVRYRPAPMPGYCAPWPGNRNATPAPSHGAVAGRRRARIRLAGAAATATPTSAATSARRYGIRARPTASV